MPNATATGRSQHAEEVARARPTDSEVRRQGVGIDDGRDRVRSVMKAIHKLESEREQQSDGEQEVGKYGRPRADRCRAGCSRAGKRGR